MLGDALDGAVFAGGIPPLEKHENAATVRYFVALQFHQLDLQMVERAFILFVAEGFRQRRRVGMLWHRDSSQEVSLRPTVCRWRHPTPRASTARRRWAHCRAAPKTRARSTP